MASIEVACNALQGARPVVVVTQVAVALGAYDRRLMGPCGDRGGQDLPMPKMATYPSRAGDSHTGTCR